MKVVGIGYSHDVNIGESYLQIEVKNIWRGMPDGAFRFYKNGQEYYLEKKTLIDEKHYKANIITLNDLDDNIKSQLQERGYTWRD